MGSRESPQPPGKGSLPSEKLYTELAELASDGGLAPAAFGSQAPVEFAADRLQQKNPTLKGLVRKGKTADSVVTLPVQFELCVWVLVAAKPQTNGYFVNSCPKRWMPDEAFI